MLAQVTSVEAGAASTAVTAGNPFFVTEVLASARRAEVPDSVRDAVRRPCRTVVGGGQRGPGDGCRGPRPRRARPARSRSAAPHADDARGVRASRPARDRQPRFATYRHELARNAVLDSLPSVRRRQLHAAVVRHLITRLRAPRGPHRPPRRPGRRLRHRADLRGHRGRPGRPARLPPRGRCADGPRARPPRRADPHRAAAILGRAPVQLPVHRPASTTGAGRVHAALLSRSPGAATASTSPVQLAIACPGALGAGARRRVARCRRRGGRDGHRRRPGSRRRGRWC